MLDPDKILLPGDPVPRKPAILLSVLAHIVVLALIAVLWQTGRVQVVPEKYETVPIISGKARLSFNPASPQAARPHPSPFQVRRNTQQARAPRPEAASNGDAAAQILREHAKQGTREMMMDLKFYQVYGFHPSHDYQLAAHTAGELPAISAAELPPRFEQYVVVEVTIDADGSVAEARIVAGLVDPPIQQKLLSAIREFKYRPAKRDGIPIPSQLDIVIHVPS